MDIAMLTEMLSCNNISLEKRLEVLKREIASSKKELDIMKEWEHLLVTKINSKEQEKSKTELNTKLNDGTWNLVTDGSVVMPVGLVGSDRIKVLLSCGKEKDGEAGRFDWYHTYEQDYEGSRILAWKFAE